jgi:WD40 repeat protein
VCRVPKGAEVVHAAFNHDGSRFAVSAGLNVTVYELPTGREQFTLRGHATDVLPIAFSADGRWIATGTDGGRRGNATLSQIHIWDANTGRIVHMLAGHKTGVRRLAFTNDGKRIVSVGADESVRIWDAEAGAAIMRLPFNSFSVGPLILDRTGRLLVSEVDAVLVWDGRKIVQRLPDIAE